MEKYLEAADKALSIAIANSPQPALVKKRYSLKDTHQVKTTTENVFRKLDDDTVVPAQVLLELHPGEVPEAH